MPLRSRYLARLRSLGGHVRPAMLPLAGLILLAAGVPAQAEDLAKQMASYIGVYYQPKPLESVDEAARSIVSIQALISLPGGGMGSKVNVSRDGIAIDSSYTYTKDETHWNPVVGGAWVGNDYVPIFGGSTTKYQEENKVNKVNWINLKDIKELKLKFDPKFKNYAWGWRVIILQKDGSMPFILAQDEVVAKKLINSLATLSVQFDSKFLSEDDLGLEYILKKEIVLKSKDSPIYGHRVVNVEVGGPSEKAGIRKNDFVIEARQVREDGSYDSRPVSQNPRICSSSKYYIIRIARKKEILEVKLSYNHNQEDYIREISVFNIKTGKIPKYAGVYLSQESAEYREKYSYPEAAKQVVSCVWRDSLGDRLGLNPGDFIAEINGIQISTSDQIRPAFSMTSANTANVWRDGKFVTIREKGVPQKLGIAVRPLNQDEMQKSGLGMDGGIFINDVEAGSLAQKIGLASGDILLTINNKRITDSQVLKAILENEDVVLVRILRNGSVIEFGKPEHF